MPNRVESSLRSLCILFLLAGCSSATTTQKPPAASSLTGDSLPGAQVLVLTGDALNAATASVNGLTLDASSAAAIDSSAAAISSSHYAKGALVTASTKSNADFTIDFSSGGTGVSDIYYGVNLQIASKVYLANPIFKKLVSHMKVDIMRFPGGQERVKYDKTAAADAAWNLGSSQAYQYLLTPTDIDRYIDLCQSLGIQADPEFNLTNNDSDMWKSLADHIVNGLGYNLQYMSAGNESDVNPTGNWSYLGANSMNTALDSYVGRYHTYVSAISDVKSGITFILGELANSGSPVLSQNLDRINAKGFVTVPGAFSVHWYLLGDYGQTSDSADFPSIGHLAVSGNNGVNIRNLSTIAATIRAKVPSSTKLVIGEWATDWSATNAGVANRGSLATAIYSAEVLEYGKSVGVDSMQYFGLSDPANFYPWNSSLIVENSGVFSVRPAYYVRFLYQHTWGEEQIEVPGGQTAPFSIYASRDASHRYLMLINRTSDQSFEKTIRMVTSGSADSTIEVLILPHSVTVVKIDV